MKSIANVQIILFLVKQFLALSTDVYNKFTKMFAQNLDKKRLWWYIYSIDLALGILEC